MTEGVDQRQKALVLIAADDSCIATFRIEPQQRAEYKIGISRAQDASIFWPELESPVAGQIQSQNRP